MFASKAIPRYWKSASAEANVADFVAVSAPVSEHDSITRDGDYLRVWRLEGVAFEASDAQVISDRHESLCNLLRNLPSGQCAVYAHRIQRRVTDRLAEPTAPSFSVEFSKFYQDSIASKPLMSKELYLTLLYRPYPSAMAKRLARGGRSKQSIAQGAADALAFMRDKGALVERTLRHFDPSLLGVREEGEELFWEVPTSLARRATRQLEHRACRRRGPSSTQERVSLRARCTTRSRRSLRRAPRSCVPVATKRALPGWPKPARTGCATRTRVMRLPMACPSRSPSKTSGTRRSRRRRSTCAPRKSAG